MPPANRLLTICLAVAFSAVGVQGDGTGLIGWGKTLYKPTCCFACRSVIAKQQLSCTPLDSTENHGTLHNPITTPPDCFVQDRAFLRTMALCIDTYCPLSDTPPITRLEDYWTSHLGTGTIGNHKYVPAMSYQDALAAARDDESRAAAAQNNNSSSPNSQEHNTHRREEAAPRLKLRQHASNDSHSEVPDGLIVYNVSSPLPKAAGSSMPLNVTSFISPVDWQLQWNYLYDFEVNEIGHSNAAFVVTIVAILLPVALSLLRFIPAFTKSHSWTFWQSLLIHPPAFGRRHREPVAATGNVPTRGQAFYIFIICILNIFLWLGPISIHQPQAYYPSLKLETIDVIGNRAGVLAVGNAVVLFLFAARNNVLLHVTDWSHGTYLLLHRWVGYWTIFHTIIHSILLLASYSLQGLYATESVQLYWTWGIVATVAACAILLFSQLWVRQRFYDFFLASHIFLALFFIIGYYYHIWFLFNYKWGYEIWIFIAAAIWAVERLFRFGRILYQGLRWATVTTIQDADGEYLRIVVEGKSFNRGGVVYLCFPTLTWRFWETHPFSVAYAGTDMASEGTPNEGTQAQPPAVLASSPEDNKAKTPQATVTDPEKATSSPPAPEDNNTTIFYSRTRSGLTKALAAKASPSVRLRVLLEGPYHHSGHISPQLAHCKDMICIAGGVGITACLPFICHSPAAGSTKLFWSSRQQSLITALAPALHRLPSSVQVETVVGERLNLEAILAREMAAGSGSPLAIVVCGPAGMADDVRMHLVELARTKLTSRPYVLVDEAFAW